MRKAWSATLALGCVVILLSALLGQAALGAARGLAATFLLAMVARRLRANATIARPPWLLLLAGGALALVSAVTRLIDESISGVESAFPSVAEAPGLVGYLFIVLAARSFWNHRAGHSDIESALDGFLVASAAAVIVFSAVLSDYIRDSSIDIWARTGNVAYTILDLVLVGYVARLAVGPGVRNTPWRFLAAATLLILLNDLFFLLHTTGSSWAQTAALIASPSAFVFAAAAIQHPEAAAMTSDPTSSPPRLSRSRLLMLGGALLTLPTALLFSLVRGTEPDLPVLVGGSAVLAVVSLARISLLFRSNERAAELEVAVSESGRGLLDASSPAELAGAISRTIALVAGHQTRFAAIVRGGSGERHLVVKGSEAGPADLESLAPDADPDLLGVLSSSGVHRVTRFDLGDRAEYGEVHLEATGSNDAAHNLALRTMAAQITQALISLSLAEARFARRSEQRLGALVEQSSDLVTILDELGRMSFVSPNAGRVLGVSPSDLISSRPDKLVHPDDAVRLSEIVQDPTKPHQHPHVVEGRLRTASGEYRWFDVTARDFRNDPEVNGIVVTARDVTDERAAKIGLKRSEQWFRGLVQHSSDVIAVLDEAGVFTYASPAAENLFGLPPEHLRGRSFPELLPPEDLEGLDTVRRAIRARPSGARNLELTLERPDKSRRTAEVTITDLRDDPSVNGLVLNVRDITDRKKLEDDLRHQVLHDDLTGLGSRLQFSNQLNEALGPKRRAGSKVAALFIDIDDFKNINDSLGHAAGDQVLVEISSRLQTGLRLQDRAARFGGDEFAVVLADVYGDSDVIGVADRIVEELSRPVTLHGQEVRMGVSVGIAVDEDGTLSPEDLIRSADVAMYEAKEQGKGRWAMFESSMADQTIERFEISNTLGGAIDNEELMVYYQPIVDLNDGHTIGVEALVRWNHPERGMISPGSFIPIAEKNGLIVPLGKYVLDRAARQVSAWRNDGHDIYASVNVSPVQLQRDGIVSEILDIVDSAGLERHAVVLELTESALINDFDLIVSRIDSLREAGLRVAIDDFGTGYATLKYAEEFAADILKVDQTFVARLESQDDSTIVSTVLSIAESMGAQTIAEGIEVPDQHRRLLALGCQLGQGHYFTRPAPAQAITETLLRELDGESLIGHGH